MDYLKQILEFIQNNQTILTILGFGSIGTLFFWIKDIPLNIYNLFKREFTTQMVVTNQQNVYYNILRLIEKTYKNQNLRYLKVTNGRWGDDEETTISMGFGAHFLRYKNTFLIITLTKDSANQTSSDKENITFLKLGRDHKIFDEIIKDALLIEKDGLTNEVYKMESSSWNFIKNQRKRYLESIFIEQDKKKIIIKTIDDFINNEDWYVSKGIPYQLGILLFGPPGTGKTSIIKTIASYLNYGIYYLPAGKLSSIENATALLPDKSILVIEDIDSNSVTEKRISLSEVEDEDDEIKYSEQNSTFGSSMLKIGLSEILNSLDGLFSSHGRILIATTNHIENLDEALIRPGRIDLKIEIGYINKEILELFFESFYPDDKVDLNNVEVNKNVTIAELQNLFLQNKSIDDIINHVGENKK